MLAPNIVVHLMSGSVIRGDDNFFEHLQMARSTFPDVYYTIEAVIAEDYKVVSHGTFTGTHRREFLGILPTGKQVTLPVIQAERLADAKIVELWVQDASLAMLQQLRGESLV